MFSQHGFLLGKNCLLKDQKTLKLNQQNNRHRTFAKYDTRRFTKIISRAISKYDNILIAGDLNIDVSESKGLIDNHFADLIDTFNLTV